MMRRRSLTLACLAAHLALIGCAPGPHPALAEAPPPPDLLATRTAPHPPPAAVGTTVLVRVAIQLRTPALATDPAWLARLQAQAQAPVHYVTAASEDTHVYALLWPNAQDQAVLLQRLAELPGVIRVERDARAQAH